MIREKLLSDILNLSFAIKHPMTSTTSLGVIEHQYPYPILTKTDKRPSALWLLEVERQLLQNAMSVANIDAIKAGWSKLVMDEKEYFQHSNCTNGRHFDQHDCINMNMIALTWLPQNNLLQSPYVT